MVWKRWEFWVVAGMSVLAAALIAYGVLTHEEPGLMKDGSATWPQELFPLKVSAVSYRADDHTALTGDHKDALKSAIKTINGRLSFKALQRVGLEETASIKVTIGVPQQKGFVDPGGHFELRTSSLDKTQLVACDVFTSNTGTQELLGLTLEHELGHCLGLAHDPFDASIMREVQSPTPMGAFPPRITDYDREVLRGLYAK
jgi:hypothetical protein